jgi:uncharacterized sulfatase
MNWSGYKEASYPGMPLLRELNRQGKLTAFQASWLSDTRPEWELYDLTTDSKGIHNLARLRGYQSDTTRLNQLLDDWIQSSHDQGVSGDPTTEPPMSEIQRAKRKDYQNTWNKRLGEPEPTDSQKLEWWKSNYGM